MNNLVHCIIIEDHIPAQKTLEQYIHEVPTLYLLKVFISPLDAISFLESNRVDLIFLDINLPHINGIEFLSSLNNTPQVILTTAFSEYAVKGFELDVVDYLLKPYTFQRFLQSVFKIKRIESSTSSEYLFIKNKHQIIKIEKQKIIYIEAKGDFVIVYTIDRSIIATTSLTNILLSLSTIFCRCHKSYIINIQYIDNISGNTIKLSNATIPIGRVYKDKLLQKIQII